ncbi:MAG: ATP-binding protein [Alphaproteobacteria bacterium]
MAFTVDTLTAVNRLNKKVHFLQPLFEAISNSLEAGATEISVNLEANEKILVDIPKKITGFSITDNGEGFTVENQESFKTLWTTHKLDIGCKGVGRLTWLRVFQKATITSYLNNSVVSIIFDKSFDPKKHITKNNCEKTTATKTTIHFENITDKYYNETVDHRVEANLEKIYDIVEKHLLVKLSLLKKEGKSFSITLCLDGDSFEITNNTIPELLEKDFKIIDSNKNEHLFKLYYNFFNNAKKQKYLYYCANNRIVNEFQDSVSPASLPNNDSVIMLLTSEYLDERVNDERNEFTLSLSNNNPTLSDPIPFPKITSFLKIAVQELILNEYPIVSENNLEIITKAIDKAPYLAKYIREDEEIIKTEKAVIENAKKKYETEKETIKNKFSSMLKKNYVDDKIFYQAITSIRDIAARELGEYIHYRQQIIEGLKKLSNKNEEIEKLVHNLFMNMKSESINEDISMLNVYDSNLWLLDDKFLSYTYAASDKKINSILKQHNLDIDKNNGSKAPDLAVFYSNKENTTDLTCVLVEIKPFGISADKKYAGLRQVRKYVNIFYENNKNIKSFWAYLITKIDDEFKDELNRDGFKPLFSTANGHKIFIKYFPDETPPIYLEVICVDAIIQDAEARNKSFLDILKQS